MKKCMFLAAVLAGGPALAQAGEIYSAIGLPGLMLGYSQPLDERLTLRADLGTIGKRSHNGVESGIDYEGKLKVDRVGLFADWFVVGGFRLTGGVTLNDMHADLDGRGNGGTITIGNNSYVAGPNDRFNVSIKFPRTTPYIGVGYGHRAAAAPGWSFSFDLGASIGKARVTGGASGPLLSNAVAQADVDQELQQVRDGVGSIKAVPQVSLGLGYRF